MILISHSNHHTNKLFRFTQATARKVSLKLNQSCDTIDTEKRIEKKTKKKRASMD